MANMPPPFLKIRFFVFQWVIHGLKIISKSPSFVVMMYLFASRWLKSLTASVVLGTLKDALFSYLGHKDSALVIKIFPTGGLEYLSL